MKRRGLASPDLGDCLAMTFAVNVAVRTQRQLQVVYTFFSQKVWMGTRSTDPHQTQNCLVKKWHIDLLAVLARVPENSIKIESIPRPTVAYWLRRTTKRSASMHTWANAVARAAASTARRASDS